MTRSMAGTTETNDAGPLGVTDMAGTAWGACRIRLAADRVPSLRSGSTHKVYRGWRFAAEMQHGHPQPGAIVFSVPVDPARLAMSRSRYALVQQTAPGATPGEETTSFSWSVSAIGTADPFAEAQTRARRRLEAAGWTQDAMVPARFAKPDPDAPTGDEASSPANVAPSPVPRGAMAPGAYERGHLRADTPLADIAGLDGWEMDGGA